MVLALIQIAAQEKKEDSLALAGQYLRKAAEAGADMAVLPEMFNCPYQTACFPVYADCRNCGNIVYNSLPTVLFQEEHAIRYLECSSLRLEFTDESAEEADRIVQVCSAAFSDTLPADSRKYNMPPATKGHFRRGVE